MFGEVLGKLDTWLGRSFLLASFIPWLIFSAVNVLTLAYYAPERVEGLTRYWGSGPFAPVSSGAVATVVVACLAYVTDPLIFFMTKALEGAILPKPIKAWLATDQSQTVRQIDDDLRSTTSARTRTGKVCEPLPRRLREARDCGLALRAICKKELVRTAEREVGVLRAKRDRFDSLPISSLETAAATLVAALQANCADADRLLQSPGSSGHSYGADKKVSLGLQRVFEEFLDLIEYGGDRLAAEVADLQAAKNAAFSPAVRPGTRFGNETAALASFVETRFNIDLDFFWPIFLGVLQGDEKATDAIVRSKQQLDFCVRLFWFSCVTTLVWFVCAASARTWTFGPIVIGTVGLLFLICWLQIVHACYRSFSEAVRGTIILQRFKVLSALHMALPDDWEAEKETWLELAHQLKWGDGTGKPVPYRHEK